MDDLRTILDQLTDRELDYVFERSKVHTDADGYRNSGVGKHGFYRWSSERRDELNAMAQRLRRNRGLAAEVILVENAEKAAEVLAALLNDRASTVKLRAADSILDRTAGRATQKHELTGKDGGPVKAYIGFTPDEWEDNEEEE